MINLDLSNLDSFVSKELLDEYIGKGKKAQDSVYTKSGEGSDFLGWVDYPISYDKEELSRVKRAASTINRSSEVLVVCGIGGSYLGAKALIDALSTYFNNSSLEIIFAGNTISSTYMSNLKDYLWDKDFSVNVISKSGTTTETAIAFRFLFNMLKKKYMKEELKEHIFITTDKEKGALHEIALEWGFDTFTVPSDMGGRYSVLSSVGLLPICAAGFDVDKILKGSADAYNDMKKDGNIALKYAAARNALLSRGYDIEILESYEPSMVFFSEWWKQLFGESEGKNGKGIFPAACVFSTDLHSMGQYIQDGRRNLIETVLSINTPKNNIDIPFDKNDLDKLNYLSGKDLNYVNNTALLATIEAHKEGGVPVMKLEIEEIDEYHLGYLVYFFEMACAISGYILGVNPFNQPGVEAYKTKMFEMLGKPGYKK